MRCRSKDLYEITALHKILRWSNCLFYCTLITSISAFAGEYSTSDFSNVSDSGNVRIPSSSISIAHRETLFVQLLKDEKITDNSYTSYAVDIAYVKNDTCCFFWAETDGSNHFTFMKEMAVGDFGVTILTQQPVFSSVATTIEILHGEGKSGTDPYVQTFYSGDSIYICASNNHLSCKGSINNALCYLENDTFCVVYKFSNAYLFMRKARLSNGTLSFVGSNNTEDWQIAKENDPNTSNNFSNVSVAGDSSGNILIIMTRGATTATKYIQYKLTNSAYDDNDTATIATGVSLNTDGNIKYADAPVVSFADKKFALVYWKSDGIYLCTLSVSGSAPSVDFAASRIVDGNTYRMPTIATNGKRVLVAWKNTSTNAIEGKIYYIHQGVITNAPGQTITLSHASTTVDVSEPELNAALDHDNDVALSWTQGNNAVGSLWGERGVYFPTAYWVSAVESVSVTSSDSLVFTPGTLDTSLNGGAIGVWVRVGPTTNTSSGWSQWASIGSSSELQSYTKSDYRYYQYKAAFTRNTDDSIKTPTLNTVTLRWNVKPQLTSFDSVKIQGTKLNTFTGFDDTIDVIAEVDTVDCFFSVRDADGSDTVFAAVQWPSQPLLACDTLSGAAAMNGTLTLMPTTVWDTVYTVTFNAQDNQSWSAVSKNATIRARKPSPVITSVEFDGKQVADNAGVSIVIGKATTVQVTLQRPHTVDWNPITYRFTTKRFDTSFTTASSLTFSPTQLDTSLRIITTDAFGASDSFLLNFYYPEYNKDSLENPLYFSKKKKLGDSLSYIIGKDNTESVLLPVKNTGNDTLMINYIFFESTDPRWFKLGLIQNSTLTFFDSLTMTNNITAIAIPPEATLPVYFLINTTVLTGDGIVRDTVYIWLNDPVCPVDTIPVMVEYNDLPQLAKVSFTFDPGKPYWLDTADAALRTLTSGYIFPPHASLAMTFSEPMDTASASGKLYAYSVFEKNTSGTVDTITLHYHWDSTFTTATLTPSYPGPSVFFKGLQPPERMFIPTDSIVVVIPSDLTDRATTPSGPNHFDVGNDCIPDQDTDTLVALRVDSIRFTLSSVTPAPSATGIQSDTAIVLVFSAPLYPGTIDTSLINNKSLVIRTRYHSSLDTNRTVSYSSVSVNGNRVTFVPARHFFYGDSVFCSYQGMTGRDTLGYPVDINNDGIAMHFFDSASAEDNYEWHFLVDNILLSSVSPLDNAKEVGLETPVTITFNQPLAGNIIDRAITGNRTLRITSRYSEGTQIGYDSVCIRDNQAVFYLNRRLFFSDSVSCQFNGLSTKDSTAFCVDMQGDSIYLTQQNFSWHFTVKELKIISVAPESAAVNADVRDPIRIRFSGPVDQTIFDTTTNPGHNRSFYFTTRYSAGKPMTFNPVTFSYDSSEITIMPAHAYYSCDSISCVFQGFRKGYSYLDPFSLIPGADTSDTILGTRSWYFLTSDRGFYTFPNPYKPGSNPRHRELGGIWFKNLHVLKPGNTRVTVKIFSIHAHPIFQSPVIEFSEGETENNPIWFWDTRNKSGELIASGIYFYCIYDSSNKILLKGKLLLIR